MDKIKDYKQYDYSLVSLMVKKNLVLKREQSPP